MVLDKCYNYKLFTRASENFKRMLIFLQFLIISARNLHSYTTEDSLARKALYQMHTYHLFPLLGEIPPIPWAKKRGGTSVIPSHRHMWDVRDIPTPFQHRLVPSKAFTKYTFFSLQDVREICDKYAEEGLSNYPSGVPFTFWEQYIWLRRQIIIAISISLAVSFLAMAMLLFNIWAAAVIVLVLAMITVEVYGFMGLAGIKLSAVPAVTLILSVGVGVEFTVHMCMVCYRFYFAPRKARILRKNKCIKATLKQKSKATRDFICLVFFAMIGPGNSRNSFDQSDASSSIAVCFPAL